MTLNDGIPPKQQANIDVVIDTVGGPTQSQLLAVLKPGGILVWAVSQPDPAPAKHLGVRRRARFGPYRDRVIDLIAQRVVDAHG